MSRSPAMSGKAMATKSLKEKWLSMVQSAREKGENGTGGSSTVTGISSVRGFWLSHTLLCHLSPQGVGVMWSA